MRHAIEKPSVSSPEEYDAMLTEMEQRHAAQPEKKILTADMLIEAGRRVTEPVIVQGTRHA